jgi:membrane-associated phospholipid phosphatase
MKGPAINRLAKLFYGSSIAQIGALLVIFNVTRRLDRYRELVWLYVLTLLLVIPISWVIPAVGAWTYYGVANLTDAYHLPHFDALRAGTMSKIVLMGVNGLITFPSFHTALAVILAYVTRGIKYVFPIFVALNILMIAATPTTGGHYFVDIVAGLALVCAVIRVTRVIYPPLFARQFEAAK